MTVTMTDLDGYISFLKMEERSNGTIEKYEADARDFLLWLDGRELTKAETLGWKEALAGKNLAPATVNGKLSTLNGFLKYLGKMECCVKSLKIQHKPFRDPGREMSREEFQRLLNAAKSQGDTRMYMVMATIAATGIRVSELRYITVEAARDGRAVVNLKGKIRTILIPGKLAKKLMKYAKKQQIRTGAIFITRNGTPLNRKQIWARMKALCEAAQVESTKVFPHNLRHLFARTHYARYHDIVCLADVLGHSSVETTRIYLITTGVEYAKQLDELRLVS